MLHNGWMYNTEPCPKQNTKKERASLKRYCLSKCAYRAEQLVPFMLLISPYDFILKNVSRVMKHLLQECLNIKRQGK